jgi:redox-sensitive bicupin YhaK (pirin superfamily)
MRSAEVTKDRVDEAGEESFPASDAPPWTLGIARKAAPPPSRTAMNEVRRVRKLTRSRHTIEGAGVHLHRAIGFGPPEEYDPFLLFDDFRSDTPAQYLKGFPWHPHRGMETITYVLAGDVEHRDSLGMQGVIRDGDVQWMSAGSGVIHQEMPKGDARGAMYGFQLWANLPAANKMSPPKYRSIVSSDIPSVTDETGAVVRVVAGRVGDVVGPVRGVVTNPEYQDVTVPAGRTFAHRVAREHTVFAYVFDGAGVFGGTHEADDGNLVSFEKGDLVTIGAPTRSVRFILVSGRPISEPIAWQGPIVMNTEDELRVAFEELENDTFIKRRPIEG